MKTLVFAMASFAIVAVFAAPILNGQTTEARTMNTQGKTVLYAAVGAEIIQYRVERSTASLTKQSAVTLPANVQEAWLSPSKQHLYVAWSNGGASYPSSDGTPPKGDHHGISAFRINPVSGALTPHGDPASLPSRPIFVTTDVGGTNVITAHNDPSGLAVHQILPDGTVGKEIPSPGKLDFGVYGHQVRVDPSGKTVILVTRGNGPTAANAEDPGALKIFNFSNGILSNRLSIAPGGGFGYQVRHLDFHPSGKWVFVTLERQNLLHTYRRTPDGSLDPTPLFVKSTLMKATTALTTQTAASVHVHPKGGFVYVANRAFDTVEFNGKQVFAGGENTIAVFSINQQSGEPKLIQSADTQGFQPRTFALDATGSLLAVANQSPLAVRDGNGARTVSASLTLFRVGADGKLQFARKYDIETGPGRNLFWTGFVSLP